MKPFSKLFVALSLCMFFFFFSAPTIGHALSLSDLKNKIAGHTPIHTKLIPGESDPYTDPTYEQCFDFKQTTQVPHTICLYLPIDGQPLENRNLLMLFPGYQEKVTAAQKFAALYSFYFKNTQRQTPILASIYSGPNNSYTDLTFNYNNSVLESFKNEVLPALKNMLTSKPDVYAFGYSLGGYNIFQLIKHYPGIFKGISVSDPALLTISPFNSASTIRKYIKRNNLKPWFLHSYLMLLRNFFSNPTNWESNNLLSALKAQQFEVADELKPYIFMSLNQEDDFGFQEGGSYFYHFLKQLGYPIELEIKPGGHVQFSFATQMNALIENTHLGLN